MAISSEQVRLRPSRLDDAQRTLYAAITDGPRGGPDAPFALTAADGSLRGPFAAMLLSPAVGDAVQQLGSALRFGSTLDDRLREIAILAVARATGSVFERDAHEAVALRSGIAREELEALRLGDDTGLSARERTATKIVESLLTPGSSDVDTDDFTAAELYELTTLAGYYRMLATQLHFFRLDEPA